MIPEGKETTKGMQGKSSMKDQFPAKILNATLITRKANTGKRIIPQPNPALRLISNKHHTIFCKFL